MKYSETIIVPKKELHFINGLLNLSGKQIYNKYGLKRDDTITYTSRLENGYEADIKVVICEEEEKPYIDAVLFDKNGCEVACTCPDDDKYDGEYRFECDGNEYVVTIIMKK